MHYSYLYHKNWKEANWNNLNSWNHFHCAVHCVSKKICAFQSLLQTSNFLCSQYKTFPVTMLWKAALIHWEELEELQLSYLQGLLQKNCSSKCCFHQHAKDTLNSHWVKSWNSPEPRVEIGKPIFSRWTSQALGWRVVLSPCSSLPSPGKLQIFLQKWMSQKKQKVCLIPYPFYGLITLHIRNLHLDSLRQRIDQVQAVACDTCV